MQNGFRQRHANKSWPCLRLASFWDQYKNLMKVIQMYMYTHAEAYVTIQGNNIMYMYLLAISPSQGCGLVIIMTFQGALSLRGRDYDQATFLVGRCYKCFITYYYFSLLLYIVLLSITKYSQLSCIKATDRKLGEYTHIAAPTMMVYQPQKQLLICFKKVAYLRYLIFSLKYCILSLKYCTMVVMGGM